MEIEQLALEEQKLANLLKASKLTSALNLALKLDRPFKVLKIVESKFHSFFINVQLVGGIYCIII